MNLRSEKTLADSAGAQGRVVLRLFVSDNLLNSFLATGATLDVHVKVTPGTDNGATVSFTLTDVLSASCDPPAEGGDTGHDIVPGEGS
jgi:hypothetical protein